MIRYQQSHRACQRFTTTWILRVKKCFEDYSENSKNKLIACKCHEQSCYGKTIAIGVMPQERLRKRVLAIARGDYKPKASDPEI